MKAEALAHERHVLAEDAFAEIVVWRVSRRVKGSTHRFKYRLALVVDGDCVLRYDNETSKGDRRHEGGQGPLTIREIARRVGRDVKAVHGDVHALIDAGLLDKTEKNHVMFPFGAIRVEFAWRAA